MDVGDLRDAETLERLRKTSQTNLDVFGDRMMGFPEEAFDGERGARECRQSCD
jgi:hypothetical protein